MIREQLQTIYARTRETEWRKAYDAALLEALDDGYELKQAEEKADATIFEAMLALRNG